MSWWWTVDTPRVRFFRSSLEIAMEGGFRPPAEARKLQDDLERLQGALQELADSLRMAVIVQLGVPPSTV